jgi:hypothetical protein
MQIIGAIIAIVRALTLIDKWIPMFVRLFRKDPLKVIEEKEAEHEAAKKKEANNDTSGTFGG